MIGVIGIVFDLALLVAAIWGVGAHWANNRPASIAYACVIVLLVRIFILKAGGI